jgi:hypothetical protein
MVDFIRLEKITVTHEKKPLSWKPKVPQVHPPVLLILLEHNYNT